MSGAGFDDGGRRVPTVEFDFDAVEDKHTVTEELLREDLAQLRQEIIARLIQFLAQGCKPKRIVRRVLLLSFLLRQGECKTQQELAKTLGVTAGRVSQELKLLRLEFAAMSTGDSTRRAVARKAKN